MLFWNAIKHYFLVFACFFPQSMYTYTQNIDALIFLSLSLTARIRFRIIATELLNRIKANHRRRKVKNNGGGGGGCGCKV